MSRFITLLLTLMSLISANLQAQDTLNNWTLGTEFFNRWNWRGISYTKTPIMQPFIEYNYQNFTFGAWGSYSLVNSIATEADLFISYDTPFGMKIDMNDYYNPFEDKVSGEYFRFKDAHIFDLVLTQSLANFDLSAAWFLNYDNDVYFEAKYHFKDFSLFAGGGNHYYTSDGKFNITNFGIELEKEIRINSDFGIPIMAKALINPDLEEFFILFGFRLESNN